jgi:predicted MPP superfamily phosphohydrolase
MRFAAYERTLNMPIAVRHVALPLGWGRRVVLAADLHADAAHFPASRIRQLVNEQDDIDAVLMPGDFVGHDLGVLEFTAEELGRINAPTFATLGNHDHMEGPDDVTAALVDAGIDVITDRAVELGGLWLAGVESRYVRAPSSGSIDAMVPDGAQCIVVGHEPNLATHHSQPLHVAGHTHHGQLRFPRAPLRLLPRYSHPFSEALATVATPGSDPDRYVYTTAGLGTTTVPIRIGVPPEIVIIDC